MPSEVEKLLRHASPALCSNTSLPLDKELYDLGGSLSASLLSMLQSRNGFYAFESSLHVFPACPHPREMDINRWNSVSLWRNEYKDLAEGCLFFAEDVFGSQFCIAEEKIYIFDPETGGLEFLTDSIHGWAGAIMDDYEFLTGYPLAHQWQVLNGCLPPNKRLLPKTPFVTGGAFAIENIYLCDSVDGMRFRANIAQKIRDLPDGTKIDFRLVR